MATFQIAAQADMGGTHNIGHLVLVPKRLVEQFGRPQELDGYKVSGQYRFEDDTGRVYTLYDWKSTSLYNDDGADSDFPTPDEFWDSEAPYDFQIGGKDDCDVGAFKVWLRYMIG